MSYLLDTNILIWFSEASPLLPESIKKTIDDNRNEIFISLASFWEIAIKHSIGKLELPTPLNIFFSIISKEYKFRSLPISETHILQQAQLPFHHNDPFDRLIYSQSLVEGLTFLYTDKVFDLYK
jgi:PIN domain nuclease of toxin-antitoxin system